jgi:MFS family permease
MVAFGFGEVIGGLFLGFFIDRFGSKKASIMNIMIILVMILVTIICVY